MALAIRLFLIATLLCIACSSAAKVKGSTTKCPRACPKTYAPVCASDGKTYSNRCVFLVAKCENPSLSFVSDGKCKKGSTTKCLRACSNKILAPVCASDGNTYRNLCVFLVAKCKNKDLSLVSFGKCKKGPLPVCADKEGHAKVCAVWKKKNACNADGVDKVCKKTCGFCKNKQLVATSPLSPGPSPVCADKEGHEKVCAVWKDQDACNAPGVDKVCKKTCGFCKNKQLG